MTTGTALSHLRLKHYLDEVVSACDVRARTARDPIQCVARYAGRPADQEVAGFFASALAYGIVNRILHSVHWVLDRMDPSPAEFVGNFEAKRDGRRFRGFVHRFNRSRDLTALCHMLGAALRRHGSLRAAFAAHLAPEHANIGPALTGFVGELLATDMTPVYGRPRLPARAGVRYFLASPADGSSCKRLNLYLRWMGRPDDGLDFGLWPEATPARLIIPLDTHIIRQSRRLGLTKRRSPGWAMAEEVTAALRILDPVDPLKYDFALCHLGMQGLDPGGKRSLTQSAHRGRQ